MEGGITNAICPVCGAGRWPGPAAAEPPLTWGNAQGKPEGACRRPAAPRPDLTWSPFLPNVSSCAARAGSPDGPPASGASPSPLASPIRLRVGVTEV